MAHPGLREIDPGATTCDREKSMNRMRNIVVLVTASFALANVGRSEVFHTSRHLSGGKSSDYLFVPEIHQAAFGLIITTVVHSEPGPTFTEKWIHWKRVLPFPALATTEYRHLPIAEYLENSRSLDADLLFVGKKHLFDDETIPQVVANFDFSRSGGWIKSIPLGWLNIGVYPWVYHVQFGWIYIVQTDPAWHKMAYLGYMPDAGWHFISEAAPGWIWSYAEQRWSRSDRQE